LFSGSTFRIRRNHDDDDVTSYSCCAASEGPQTEGPQTEGPQTEGPGGDGICLCRTETHVLSFKMTVAKTRKKVFHPRVTAKPRHTIIRDKPQPVDGPSDAAQQE